MHAAQLRSVTQPCGRTLTCPCRSSTFNVRTFNALPVTTIHDQCTTCSALARHILVRAPPCVPSLFKLEVPSIAHQPHCSRLFPFRRSPGPRHPQQPAQPPRLCPHCARSIASSTSPLSKFKHRVPDTHIQISALARGSSNSVIRIIKYDVHARCASTTY